MSPASAAPLRRRALRWGLLVLAPLVLVVAPFLLIGERMDLWSAGLIQGHRGGAMTAAIGVLLLTADVLLPIPASLVLTTLGLALGGVGGALTGMLGMTLGCALALALGRSLGEPAAQRLLGAADYALLVGLFERYGVAVLAACRAAPVLAEASVLAAGAAGLPPTRALLVTTLANAGVSAGYALLGAAATDLSTFVVAASASILVPGIVLMCANRLRRRSAFAAAARPAVTDERAMRHPVARQRRLPDGRQGG